MKNIKLLLTVPLIISTTLFNSCSDVESATSEEKSVNVQVKKVEKVNISETLAYSGTIEESETVPLSFNIPGTVLKVFVSEGEYVKKGQLLASINDESIKNAHEVSLATLQQAEDAYKRLEPMYKNGNLPEIRFVEVKTGLQQAKATAAISKKNLHDCKLHSPISGYVGSKSIEPGMNVMPGVNAINIVRINKVYANVSISENEISTIKKGQEANIVVGALSKEIYKGRVEEIGVMADPISHTYKIKVIIPNEEKLIKPGMICNVRIQKQNKTEGVIIPNQAVQINEKGKTFVFKVNEENNTAIRKYVETGKLLTDGIEIPNGLAQGDLVVVSGQQKLINEMPVTIVN